MLFLQLKQLVRRLQPSTSYAVHEVCRLSKYLHINSHRAGLRRREAIAIMEYYSSLFHQTVAKNNKQQKKQNKMKNLIKPTEEKK